MRLISKLTKLHIIIMAIVFFLWIESIFGFENETDTTIDNIDNKNKDSSAKPIVAKVRKKFRGQMVVLNPAGDCLRRLNTAKTFDKGQPLICWSRECSFASSRNANGTDQLKQRSNSALEPKTCKSVLIKCETNDELCYSFRGNDANAGRNSGNNSTVQTSGCMSRIDICRGQNLRKKSRKHGSYPKDKLFNQGSQCFNQTGYIFEDQQTRSYGSDIWKGKFCYCYHNFCNRELVTSRSEPKPRAIPKIKIMINIFVVNIYLFL